MLNRPIRHPKAYKAVSETKRVNGNLAGGDWKWVRRSANGGKVGYTSRRA